MKKPLKPVKKARVKQRFEPIRGEEAHVSLVPKTPGFPRNIIERRLHHKPNKRFYCLYSAGHSLAHLLFPKNFVKQFASSRDRTRFYSKLKELDNESQEAIREFYKRLYSKRSNYATFGAHSVKALFTTNAVRSFLEDAGIRVNEHLVNIGFDKKGNPVFFEISAIRLDKLEDYIKSRFKRDRVKRKLAEAYLKMIRRNLESRLFFLWIPFK